MRAWVHAWLIIPLVFAIAYAVTWVTGLGRFDLTGRGLWETYRAFGVEAATLVPAAVTGKGGIGTSYKEVARTDARAKLSSERRDMHHMLPWKERALFLKAWFRSPLGVGSVTPSAPALTRRMVERIPWHQVRTVVELGAGTGVITARLRERKPPSVQLLAFEREPRFRHYLKHRYPDLDLHGEVRHLCAVLAEKGTPQADVIISGIPFGALPAARQQVLLADIDRALAPGGMFVAFQYSLMLRRQLRQRFERVDLGFALANLPPAFIYYCYKPAAAPEQVSYGR